MGESTSPRAKLRFDRRVRLEFRGATITSDAGLLACRELDDALGLTETANECLQESRGGRNVQHRLVGLLRQSVYSRLAGYEDTNDAERLADDPTMRVSVGSYRPVIAGAKLREGKTTILPRGGERSGESACLQCAFTPLAVLPARPGKKLWVIARQGPEGTMKNLARHGISTQQDCPLGREGE